LLPTFNKNCEKGGKLFFIPFNLKTNFDTTIKAAPSTLFFVILSDTDNVPGTCCNT
jgi:hypothetical protein